MRGGHVREHWVLQLEPREAHALQLLLEDVRAQAREGAFGINELEDETAEAIIDVLAERGDADAVGAVPA